jgi:hypothetical protein
MSETIERKQGVKNKMTSLLAILPALLLLAVWAPSAEANSTTSSCVVCHPIWGGSSSTGHQAHLGIGLGCTDCHGSIGDTPATSTCGSCHVVLGVARHHTSAGASSCSGCHPGTPAPENTPVPGYAGTALDPCDGSEELFASVTTSLDNDGDQLYDMADPDCAPPVEDCNDGVDNDGDGMIDCNDQDCSADPACMVPDQEFECADGIDNDMDGQVDCADMDCAADPACQPLSEICNDGMDNDGDGLADCADTDCVDAANCQPQPTPENCSDGVDNDGDGMIDCNDQDCASNPVCQQPIMEICDDGIDNDDDGFIDCKDSNCTQNPVCQKNETCPQFNPPADHTKLEDEDECEAFHAPGYEKPFSNNCTACHGQDLTGSPFAPSCFTCHDEEWDEMAPVDGGGNPPADHTDEEEGAFHKPGKNRPYSNGCTDCHGSDLTGGFGPSCFACHGREWDEHDAGNPPPANHPFGWTDPVERHEDYVEDNGVGDCIACHSIDPADQGQPLSCFNCHGQEWYNHNGDDDGDDGDDGDEDCQDQDRDRDRDHDGDRRGDSRRFGHQSYDRD